MTFTMTLWGLLAQFCYFLGFFSPLIALVVVPMALYLGVLTAMSRRRPPPPVPPELPSFVVVVPAHNEASQIGQTVHSLRGVDYPASHHKIWVVADNCTDNTAELARAAGATVLERQNPTQRGKGYALDFAFTQILATSASDAVVVVDADSVVSTNLLRAFAARLAAGAQAAQADYGVRNPNASWRTQLMVIALAMFHRVRSLGRENMGVSCGLRGNGMCFSLTCLRQFPHHAVGLVEDVEYGISLGQGGVRVHYVDEAQVLGEMVSRGDASASQRERWEGGRRALVRQALGPLVRSAWQKKSGLLADLAMDLYVLPLSQLGLLLFAGTLCDWAPLVYLSYQRHQVVQMVSGFVPPEMVREALPSASDLVPAINLFALRYSFETYAYGLAWLSLLVYLLRGLQLSNLGWAGVRALYLAPLYMLWKLALRFKPNRGTTEWVRTQREDEPKQ